MRIANYQTLEQISKVACAVLYRARYLKDGKLVLLKQLDPAHADAVHSEHFKREYQLLQSLDVAELVKPIALIDEQGELAAIHEDFPGESLDAILAEGAPLDWPVCLVIARYPAYALEGIHAARVIHQDIRPATILFDSHSGEVRLMNFSIALTPERNTLLREDGAVSSGDWAYVSPELVLPTDIGHLDFLQWMCQAGSVRRT